MLVWCVQEKVDALKVLGADVRPVPAVPITDPKNYNHQVRSEYNHQARSEVRKGMVGM